MKAFNELIDAAIEAMADKTYRHKPDCSCKGEHTDMAKQEPFKAGANYLKEPLLVALSALECLNTSDQGPYIDNVILEIKSMIVGLG